jgi:hypothetical protein
MINIKKYIDRVSASESRGGRDIVMSMEDARQLRDEIARLLLDLQAAHRATASNELSLEFVGGKW